jgi:ribosomal protein L37AE/L43A
VSRARWLASWARAVRRWWRNETPCPACGRDMTRLFMGGAYACHGCGEVWPGSGRWLYRRAPGREVIACRVCGEPFNPADLDAVVFHETHRPSLATGITGRATP